MAGLLLGPVGIAAGPAAGAPRADSASGATGIAGTPAPPRSGEVGPDVTDEVPETARLWPGEAPPGGLLVNGGTQTASTDRVVVPMLFPMIGNPSWRDTFLQCRATACSRRHLGQDLIIGRMTPLVAAWDGRVTYLRRGDYPTQSSYVSVQRADRAWTVNYIHVNNDNPGTDDGRGTDRWGFLPGLRVGQQVSRGQLLGWVGDSGDSENSVPHLHVELRKGDAWSGTAYNAKPSLDAAARPSRTEPASNWRPAGSLVRVNGRPGVYRVGADGRRVLVADSYLPLSGLSAASAAPITVKEMLSFPFAGWEAPPVGSVLRGSDGQRWVATPAGRVLVDDAWFGEVGLSPSAARTVADSALAETPVAPSGTARPGVFREGAYVRQTGDARTFRVAGGQLRPVGPAYQRVVALSSVQVHVLPAGTLGSAGTPGIGAALPVPDGTMLRTTSNGETWFVWGGQAHRAANPTFMWEYRWVAVTAVPVTFGELTSSTPYGGPVWP